MSAQRQDVDAAFVLARSALAGRATQSLLAFTKYTKPDFEINWHHRITARALEKFAAREIENLMILMPPRVGKTELVSRRFPAWCLGRNPDIRLIAASYADELASSNNRDVQRIIDSPDFQDLFPETRLSGSNVRSSARGSWLRNNNIFEVVGRRGTYRSAGVDGSITGTGGDLILVDDPIKNSAEADSKARRDKVWDWYRSTLYSRREGGAGICIVMTRWHEDDLAGRVLANAKETGQKWTVISFPMLHEGADAEPPPYDVDPYFAQFDVREEGQALWPGKYDVAESLTIKGVQGSRNWSALYQQRPRPAEGSIIKRVWLKNRFNTPPEALDEMIISVDAAFKDTKSSAYVAIGVWGRKGANKYLVDQVREKLGFVATVKTLTDLCAKYPFAHVKLVEEKANGAAIIETLQDKIPGLIPIEPKGSKEARLHACETDFEAGNVWLPESAPWVHDYIQELLAFPNSAYADQVDQTTQALLRFREGGSAYLAALAQMSQGSIP